jgi:PurA-like ssDNA and RNA-binding protein
MTSDPSPNNYATLLTTEKFATGRKLFFIDMKENHRGRFLKITEDVVGRRNTIVVPMEAVREFAAALNRMIAFAQNL